MVFHISKTADNVKTYPLHTHGNFEIMFYIEGEGFLHTPEKDYPFTAGTAIIVPPNIPHGSVSENGFKNISVGGSFGHLLMFEAIKTIYDNTDREGEFFANAIYRNRFSSKALLNSLAESYIHFLLQNTEYETPSLKAVNELCRKIAENAFDSSFNLTDLLTQSGYAEDYIRMCFTKQIGMPPLKFLNKLRIDRAAALINIYKKELPLSQIAEKCGFQDYVYFSKKFKQITGASPKEKLSLKCKK